jgi:phenylalanyl-tRNA synthetase alpha chain
VERETVVYGFKSERDAVVASLEAAGITGDEIGTLTSELLAPEPGRTRPSAHTT